MGRQLLLITHLGDQSERAKMAYQIITFHSIPTFYPNDQLLVNPFIFLSIPFIADPVSIPHRSRVLSILFSVRGCAKYSIRASKQRGIKHSLRENREKASRLAGTIVSIIERKSLADRYQKCSERRI